MRLRDVRLVPVAGAAWSSAVVAGAFPLAAPWIALALWATTFLAAAYGALRSRRSLAVVLIVVASAVGSAAASHVALAQPSRASAAALAVSGGRAVVVSATVVGKAERTSSGDVAFDAQAHAVTIGGQTTAVDTPVLVRSSARIRPDVGAEVLIEGTAQRAEQGERGVLIVRAGRSLDVVREPTGVLAVAAQLRHRLVQATRGLPDPGAGLISGLAVGDTSAVGPELDAAMKASSLSHLTAVSGANCAIVVGLAFAAAALCGARRGCRVASGARGPGRLRAPRDARAERGAGRRDGDDRDARRVAGAGSGQASRSSPSAICCSHRDPWLATSLGFALSAAATAALLVLRGPLAQGLARWMPRRARPRASVPLAAQLACGPLLVLVNPTVPSTASRRTCSPRLPRPWRRSSASRRASPRRCRCCRTASPASRGCPRPGSRPRPSLASAFPSTPWHGRMGSSVRLARPGRRRGRCAGAARPQAVPQPGGLRIASARVVAIVVGVAGGASALGRSRDL